MNDDIKALVQRLDTDFAKVPDELLESVRRQFEQHSHSVKLDAQVATYNRLFRSPKPTACAKASIVTICGRGRTNKAGRSTVPVIFCDRSNNWPLVIVDVLCFLATSNGQTPAALSATIKSTAVQTVAGQYLSLANPDAARNQYLEGVTADVMLSQLDGKPAAGTDFSWSCTVEVSELWEIGG